MRKSASGRVTNLTFPMLTRGNYIEWVLTMECNLQVASRWLPVEDDMVTRKEDWQAIAALICSTPSKMHDMLAVKLSAKEAWVAVRTHRLSSNCVRKANTQKLQADFESTVFYEGELGRRHYGRCGSRAEDPAYRFTSFRSAINLHRDLA